VHAALDKVDAQPENAVLIGDTPWDVEAALKAGVPTLTVLTGGFSAQELTDAGAVSVFESVAQLGEQLHWTALK
jgi:phosphoglycolate phosphatase-like HAD superfamily hydrolase